MTHALTGGSFTVYNFGVPGHGPQHMLAEIEHGIVDSVVKKKPRLVIYQAIRDHVFRVAGFRGYVLDGPRYLLSSAGEVIYAGNFLKCNPVHDNCFTKKAKRHLKVSHLFKRLLLKRITDKEIEIFMKVVENSRRLLKEKYPELEFHVVFWHRPQDRTSNAILRAFQERDFNIHLIQQIIPDYNEHHDRYHILHDGHPNGLAYRELAHYITENLVTPNEHHSSSARLTYTQPQNSNSNAPGSL